MRIIWTMSYFCVVHEKGNVIKSNVLFYFRAAPEAYGGSQARGQIRAVAAGLYHGHSNTASKQRLRSTPQLMAMLDS